MDLGLEGKTAIVTGGGSNIGRGIIFGFARETANVVNAEIAEAQGKKVVDEANALGGGKVMFVKTDVTDWDSVQAMVKQTLDEFGKVDILVNVVGWVKDESFLKYTREDWEKEIARNFWSDINCIRAVIDHMVERKYGRIISIGSEAGRVGQEREVVYSGCKAGAAAMSKSLAKEFARHGITFNTVCPGITIPESKDVITGESMWAREELLGTLSSEKVKAAIIKGIPLGRLGTPEDVANAVLFLASDRAEFVTGQILSVSGGYTMV